MKEIMFSRVFPAYHPRKGEPTYFVEQMLKQLIADRKAPISRLDDKFVNRSILDTVGFKSHTIRKGHNFSAGDYFLPKVWTEMPYRSVKYQFAPSVIVEKTFDFEIKTGSIFVNGVHRPYYASICKNDGLEPVDFANWFRLFDYLSNDFDGQIICWNAAINY